MLVFGWVRRRQELKCTEEDAAIEEENRERKKKENKKIKKWTWQITA